MLKKIKKYALHVPFFTSWLNFCSYLANYEHQRPKLLSLRIYLSMKHFYLLILFLVTSLGFSQDNPGRGNIEGFKLYPNPTTNGKVYISTSQNAPKNILIYDVLGTQVLETTILGKELNISDLDAGVYVLRVFEKDKVATRKLIIK